MKAVKLKNGSEEADVLVGAIITSLKSLLVDAPIALVDLSAKCRDESYKWFGNNEQICKNLSLVQPDGTIHESIKNIVLSTTRGEGLELELVSPYQESEDK